MFALMGKPRALPLTQEVMLLRAVQEALTNAAKHASVNRTEVTLNYAKIVRDGLRAVLSAEGITVVGECASGEEAIVTAARLMPDVVLMDLRLRGTDGVEATRQIVTAGTGKVLVLTTYDTDGGIVRAVEAGATGYLLKDASRQALVQAVSTAALSPHDWRTVRIR